MSQETKPTDTAPKGNLFSLNPPSGGKLFGSDTTKVGGLFGGASSTGLAGGSLFNKPADTKPDDSKPKAPALGNAFNAPTQGKDTAGTQPKAGGAFTFGAGGTSSGSSGGALFAGAGAKTAGTADAKTEEKKPADAKPAGIFGNNPPASGSLFGNKTADAKPEEKKPEVKPTGSLNLGGSGSLGIGNTAAKPEEKKTEIKPAGGMFGGNTLATGGLGFGAKPDEKKPEIKPAGGMFGGNTPATGGLNLGGTAKPEEKKPLGGGIGGSFSLTGNKPEGSGIGAGFGGMNKQPMTSGSGLGGGLSLGQGAGGLGLAKKTDGGDMSVEGVLDKWKNDLNNKAKEFEMLTQNIVEYEKQIMANLEVEQELVKELEKMENEYKAVEFSLEGIIKGQDTLAEKVEELEGGISKYQYPNAGVKVDQNKMSRDDLIKLAEAMNKEIEGMDNEILKLTDEMSKSAEKKDANQLSENVLGNYLKTLQFIEAETLKAMTQLNKIENHLANQ